jgi:hypothetical protein
MMNSAGNNCSMATGQAALDPRGLSWPGDEDPYPLADKIEAACRGADAALVAHALHIQLFGAVCAIRCRECQQAVIAQITGAMPGLLADAMAEPVAVENQ